MKKRFEKQNNIICPTELHTFVNPTGDGSNLTIFKLEPTTPNRVAKSA